jgi:predicted glycosyltransferase involved in capsule biosynthesis
MTQRFDGVTYIIPCQIESADRLRNAITTVGYLLAHCQGARVMVREVNSSPVFRDRAMPEIAKIAPLAQLDYQYEASQDPFFHKTRILNDMIIAADTDVICSHDIDVIYPLESHRLAYELTTTNQFDLIYPYGCGIYQIRVQYPPEAFQRLIASRWDLLSLQQHSSFANSTIGWTQWYRKDAVLAGGAWNEGFVAWGCEDNEFYFRFSSLGYRIARFNAHIWHLEHSRTQNSWWNNPRFKDNDRLWQWMREQDRDTIVSYLKQQDYVKARGIDDRIQ